MENAQPEPSMEEILASIRRIISEDEDDQATPAEAAASTSQAAPEAKPETKPETGQAAPQSKPELTLTKSTPPAETPAAAPAPQAVEEIEMIKQNVTAAISEEPEEEMLDQTTAAVASKAFQTLSQSVRISEGPGKTLEDIVTEMLKPMIKEWLDANLPAIVEEKVEEEVQRVARRRRA